MQTVPKEQTSEQYSSPFPSGLIERVKVVLMKPKDFWPSAKEASLPSTDLLKSHLVPLAAASAVATFIGLTFIGVGPVRTGIVSGLSSQLIQFGISLGAAYLMAFIVEKLAPSFDGQVDFETAFTYVALAMTPALLAGLFNIVPLLGLIGMFLGLYSVYLLYQGASVMTGVSENKRFGFVAVTVLTYIVVAVVASLVITPIVT